jgi:hypothetical protein
MIFQKVRSYWKRITGIILGAAALLGALWSLSGYVIRADDFVDEAVASHQLAQTNEQNIKGLIEYQRGELERQRREAEAQRAKWLEVWKLCMAKTITDEKLCAEAAAALK